MVLVSSALMQPESPQEVNENYLYAKLLVSDMADHPDVQPHLLQLRRLIRRYDLQPVQSDIGGG
jgi:hypothetical protein